MHDELTAVDIKKMEQEVEYRRHQQPPPPIDRAETPPPDSHPTREL